VAVGGRGAGGACTGVAVGPGCGAPGVRDVGRPADAAGIDAGRRVVGGVRAVCGRGVLQDLQQADSAGSGVECDDRRGLRDAGRAVGAACALACVCGG